MPVDVKSSDHMTLISVWCTVQCYDLMNNSESFIFLNMNPAPPEIVPFTFGDKPRSEGQSATVTCSVDGDKPVGVRWMLNDKEIDGNMNVTVIPLGDAGSIISIPRVTAQHVGWYTCIAKNLAGVTQHSAQLSVTGISECANLACFLPVIPFVSSSLYFVPVLHVSQLVSSPPIIHDTKLVWWEHPRLLFRRHDIDSCL